MGPARAAAAAASIAAACGMAESARGEDGATPADLRLGYERIELPGKERLGIVGAGWLLPVTPNLLVGPAFHGALTGARGGLFTVGVEAAWRQPLGGRWSLQAGAYAGGGGGGAAPVGGGLMVRPHVDLLAGFGGWRAGVSWSRVRFPNGSIDSSQLGIVLAADAAWNPLRADAPAGTSADGLGFDRVVGVVGAYRPSGSSRPTTGAPMESRVGFVGARFEHAFGDRILAGFETNGAASGGVGGYAEALATLAAETPLGADETLRVGGRLALGMGGGGAVSVGGGLLVKAAAYATWQVAPALALGLEGGVARAPDGSFKAPFAAFLLDWRLAPAAAGGVPAPAVRNEWIVGVERYDAARRDGSVRVLDAVVLKANRFLGERFYVSAQVHSAIDGDAGGYTVGLAGVGWQSPAHAGWRVGVELLAGAGGGGGVDSGGGALVQPGAYVDWSWSPASALRLGVGRIDAVHGALRATTAEVAFVHRFDTGGR